VTLRITLVSAKGKLAEVFDTCEQCFNWGKMLANFFNPGLAPKYLVLNLNNFSKKNLLGFEI
jgi:hypothetical protein